MPMMEKFLVVCSVRVQDIQEARITIESMCRHTMRGHIISGFGVEDSLQYLCNSTGAGDPTHCLCFSSHTDFYINKWRGLEYEYRIRDKCPSYFCDKVESEESYLSAMNLKKIEK
jgi:hypothetical protein